jgi:hypothetical protein
MERIKAVVFDLGIRAKTRAFLGLQIGLEASTKLTTFVMQIGLCLETLIDLCVGGELGRDRTVVVLGASIDLGVIFDLRLPFDSSA